MIVSDFTVVRPIEQRFRSTINSALSLIEHRSKISDLVNTRGFRQEHRSGSEGEAVRNLIDSDAFFQSLQDLVDVASPVYQLMCRVDSELFTVGYMYDACFETYERLKKSRRSPKKLSARFLHRWSWFLHPLHCAGYALNPAYIYMGKRMVPISETTPSSLRRGHNEVFEGYVECAKVSYFPTISSSHLCVRNTHLPSDVGGAGGPCQ